MLDQQATVRATWAADLFDRHLGMLKHPGGDIVRLVQFAHDSPGLRKYKRKIAEALVHLVESNGGHIHNGLDGAVSALRAAGYTVHAPTGVHGIQTQPDTTNTG